MTPVSSNSAATAASGSTSFDQQNSSQELITVPHLVFLAGSAQQTTGRPLALEKKEIDEARRTIQVIGSKGALFRIFNGMETNTEVLLLNGLDITDILGMDFNKYFPRLRCLDLSSLPLQSQEKYESFLEKTGLARHENLRHLFLPQQLSNTKVFTYEPAPEILSYDGDGSAACKKQFEGVLQKLLIEWVNDPSVTGNKEVAQNRILECFRANAATLKLDLSGLGLSELPHALRILYLKPIVSIDVSNNKLTSHPDMAHFRYLKQIDLSYNGLDFIEPKLFPSGVEILKVRKNNISSLPDLSRFKDLKHLDCENNKISEFSTQLDQCGSLQHLNLSTNKIVVFTCTFENNASLLEINLGGNQIATADKLYAPLLQKLILHKNQLTRLPKFELFGTSEHLEVLDLSDNKIEELDFNSLFPSQEYGDPRLRELDLCNNRLSDVPPSIEILKNLNSLKISDNLNLKQIPLEILFFKLQLIECDVKNTQINEKEVSLELCKSELHNKILNELGNLIKKEQIELKEKQAKYLGLDIDLDCSSETVSYFFEKDSIRESLQLSSVEECSLLLDWLKRLKITERRNVQDYRSCLPQEKSLSQALVSLIQDLLDPTKKEFRELIFDYIRENNTRCTDRTAMAFNEIYVAWKLLLVNGIKDEAKHELLIRVGNTLAFQKAFYQQLSEIPKTLVPDYVADRDKVEVLLYYQNQVSETCKLLTFMNITENNQYVIPVDLNVQKLCAEVEKRGREETLELFAVETLVKKEKAKEWNAAAEKAHLALSVLDDEQPALEEALKQEKANEILALEEAIKKAEANECEADAKKARQDLSALNDERKNVISLKYSEETDKINNTLTDTRRKIKLEWLQSLERAVAVKIIEGVDLEEGKNFSSSATAASGGSSSAGRLYDKLLAKKK